MVLEIREFDYEPNLDELAKIELENGKNPRHIDLFQLDDKWFVLIFSNLYDKLKDY